MNNEELMKALADINEQIDDLYYKIGDLIHDQKSLRHERNCWIVGSALFVGFFLFFLFVF